MMPLLPVLDSEADSDGFPKRLILFYYPIGTSMAGWRCTGTERDFTLSPALMPLERHKDSLIILDGIDQEVSANNGFLLGHPGLVAFFTGIEPLAGDFTTCTSSYGWAGGPSVDQFVADAYGDTTPVRSLCCGTMLQTNDHSLPYSRLSYRGANQPVAPLEDPARIFSHLFGDVDLDPTEVLRQQRQRQSVIDAVAGDILALERQIRGSDRDKLDAHLDNLRLVEHRIQNPLGAACAAPIAPTAGICAYNARSDCNEANMPVLFDLMTTALACDVTRIVAYQGASEGNGPRMPHHTDIPHELSHRSDPEGYLLQTEVTAFWMDALAQLLDRLASVPEGDGTLLDNTLVVAGCAIGEAWYHGARNLPIVLAGGAGGYFETGRYLRYGSYPADGTIQRGPHGGRSMNDLLISICHAMGLPEVATFGNPSYCTGPLDELVARDA
jgi:hypothetical protein